MRKRGWLVWWLCLVAFVLFTMGTANDLKSYWQISKSYFFKLAVHKKVDRLDLFRQELVVTLAEVMPDKQSYNRACELAYLQEEIIQDETIYSLYLEQAPGKDMLVWCVEADRLADKKAMKELAQDAAYLLLYHISKKPIPIKPPSAKKVLV